MLPCAVNYRRKTRQTLPLRHVTKTASPQVLYHLHLQTVTPVTPLDSALTKTAGYHPLFLPPIPILKPIPSPIIPIFHGMGDVTPIALSPLAATLIDLPASVANKRLTVWLNSLDATLTKNTGEGSRLWLTRNPTRFTVLSDHRERGSTCPDHVRPRIASHFPTGLPPCRPNATIWSPMTPANPQLSTAARPRVGIPWRTSHEEANQITNKLQYYFAAVTEAAGEPIPISLQLSPQQLAAQIKDLDAFVLPGGPADVNPSLYRAARHEKTHHADSNREKTDFAILEHAFASGKPVLAICYGCQSLNVCLGGTLYQDIASELHTKIEHSKDGLPPDAPDPLHPARIAPGVEIAQLAASSGLVNSGHGFDVQINTSHHQSVRDLGHGLRVAAVAPDGVIEAIELEPHKHWVVGVQWHPERMKGDALAAALFRALVQ